MMGLYALSPLDGRYENETASLRDYFSEYAIIRNRVRIELDFLTALSNTGLCPPPEISPNEFTGEDAQIIQQYEKITRHDVKAIEYYLREKLPPNLHPWIHFGLTSEDLNNIAYATALKESRDAILMPALDELTFSLFTITKKYRSLPMLARTHGQPAVPTTLGKEIAIYLARIFKFRKVIAGHEFEAKLSGAVGNFNALQSAAPEIDWIAFSKDFIRSKGLTPNLYTTQILPYDNWLWYFESLRMINSVLIGYAQDMWRYASMGILKQMIIEAETGSSTMPQKVNPIDFENAEGNLGLANSLLAHFCQKLPISRLQRDLSDSTVRRSFGSALGHTLLAWKNLTRGMSRVEADEATMKRELNEHWEILSEGAQTILRKAGRPDAYESLKSRVRGHPFSEADFKSWVEALDVNEATRSQLRFLSPESYIGLAVNLTDQVIRELDAGNHGSRTRNLNPGSNKTEA